jgi:hypothetical protein
MKSKRSFPQFNQGVAPMRNTKKTTAKSSRKTKTLKTLGFSAAKKTKKPTTKRVVKTNRKSTLKDNLRAESKLVDQLVPPAPVIPDPLAVTVVTRAHQHAPLKSSSRDYDCFACGKQMKRGDKYARTCFQYDRASEGQAYNEQFYKERACPDCSTVIEMVGKATGFRPSPLALKAVLENKVARGELTGAFVLALADFNKRFVGHGHDKPTVFKVVQTLNADGTPIGSAPASYEAPAAS